MKSKITLSNLVHLQAALETADNNLRQVREKYEGCEILPTLLDFRTHNEADDLPYRITIDADKYLISYIIEKHIERLGEIAADARRKFERAERVFYKQLREKIGEAA